MPSCLEKVPLSLSGTSAANSTFDFLADEFEEEARTRENLDELAGSSTSATWLLTTKTSNRG